MIGKEKATLALDETMNRIKIRTVEIGAMSPSNAFLPSGRSHFVSGELAAARFIFDYIIRIPGIVNWQVFAESYWLDGSGAIIEAVVANTPWFQNLATTTRHIETALVTRSTPILAAAKKNRLKLRLFDPTRNVTVSVDSVTFDVRTAQQFAQRSVPTGSPVVSFSPLPAGLNFSYNGRAGTAWVEEYGNQSSG